MKVFVYRKDNSKKIAEIHGVTSVTQTGNLIHFTNDNGTLTYHTKKVKTTIYQN